MYRENHGCDCWLDVTSAIFRLKQPATAGAYKDLKQGVFVTSSKM